MKVHELIKILQTYDPELNVALGNWNTEYLPNPLADWNTVSFNVRSAVVNKWAWDVETWFEMANKNELDNDFTALVIGDAL